MRNTLLSNDIKLFRALCNAEVSERRALQLQNLAAYCNYRSWAVNSSDAEFCILTTELSCPQTAEIVCRASKAGHTIAVISPYLTAEREAMCHKIVSQHNSTTVDNRGYLLIFNNNLPKQHFRI